MFRVSVFIRVRLWEKYFPLISLIYTDIPRICVHPCSSVGEIYLLALRAEILTI